MVQDILINNTQDLQIMQGDFTIGDSTLQHQQHLLLGAKGDYKLTPLVGVDAFTHLHDHRNTLARDARLEFIADGMTVHSMKTIKNELYPDANY